MKIKALFTLICLAAGVARADWAEFGGVNKFIIANVQYLNSVGSNIGQVKVFVQELPTTFFVYSYPASGGVQLEQAKIHMSILMTAFSTGTPIKILLPSGTGVAAADNEFIAIKTEQ